MNWSTPPSRLGNWTPGSPETRPIRDGHDGPDAGAATRASPTGRRGEVHPDHPFPIRESGLAGFNTTPRGCLRLGCPPPPAQTLPHIDERYDPPGPAKRQRARAPNAAGCAGKDRVPRGSVRGRPNPSDIVNLVQVSIRRSPRRQHDPSSTVPDGPRGSDDWLELGSGGVLPPRHASDADASFGDVA